MYYGETSSHIIAMEIKSSEKVWTQDFRHIHSFQKIVKKKVICFIIYRGAETQELSENIFAIPDYVFLN